MKHHSLDSNCFCDLRLLSTVALYCERIWRKSTFVGKPNQNQNTTCIKSETNYTSCLFTVVFHNKFTPKDSSREPTAQQQRASHPHLLPLCMTFLTLLCWKLLFPSREHRLRVAGVTWAVQVCACSVLLICLQHISSSFYQIHRFLFPLARNRRNIVHMLMFLRSSCPGVKGFRNGFLLF